MVTQDKKRKVLEEILCSNDDTLQQTQATLHSLLLEDTTNGKLYKYRYFDDNGYALDNLKNGTLYCANPSHFNDPFDCHAGVTLKSIHEAMYQREFDLLEQLLQKFISVAIDSASLSDCTADEQRVLNKLLFKPQMVQFVNIKLDTEEDVTQYLTQNADVITALLQTVIDDPVFTDQFKMCAKLLPTIVSSVSLDGKLQLSENALTIEKLARSNGIVDDTDEIGLTLLLSSKLQPHLADSVSDVDSFINSVEQKILQKTDKLFRIGCLCTDNKNRLMWSHYADGHKGFCIEYDFSSTDIIETALMPFPVIYSTERPLIPWKPSFSYTDENINAATIDILLSLLTKDCAWEYENEWRLFIDSQDCPNIKMPPISCIYLGALVRQEDRNVILAIAKQRNIPVKQMRIDRGAYKLHATEV